MAFTNMFNPSSTAPFAQKRQSGRIRSSTAQHREQMTGRQMVVTYPWFKFIILTLFALATASFSQPIVATTGECHSLLPHGDFEESADWQIKNSDGLPLFSTQVVHSGQQSAYLGGRHNAADRLSTTVQLPAEDMALTLQFWWQLQSQETVTGSDQLEVLVVEQQSGTYHSLFQLNGLDVTDQWQSVSIDLSPFAGQTLELQFLSLTDAEQITDFFIDDIDVLACGATMR